MCVCVSCVCVRMSMHMCVRPSMCELFTWPCEMPFHFSFDAAETGCCGSEPHASKSLWLQTCCCKQLDSNVPSAAYSRLRMIRLLSFNINRGLFQYSFYTVSQVESTESLFRYKAKHMCLNISHKFSKSYSLE